MSHEAHEKLARLEISLGKGTTGATEYKQQKWEILQNLHSQAQIVKPVFRDQRKRKIEDSRGVSFNYIAPSPFIFGPDGDYAELKSGIYMATFPVTVGEFRIFLQESGWDYPEADLEQLLVVCPDPNCPVSHVSWIDAKEYCRWLRRETKEYYSLPTENEWEIAARGIDGRLYPWGYEEPDSDYACFQGEKQYNGTVPVGATPNNQSPYGCMDMVGNVWEWCLDSVDDPRDPHILRGGSWRNNVEYVTCIAQSFSFPPEKRINYGGFRIIYLPEDLLQDYQKQQDSDIEMPKRRLKIVNQDLDLMETTSDDPSAPNDNSLQPSSVNQLANGTSTEESTLSPSINFREMRQNFKSVEHEIQEPPKNIEGLKKINPTQFQETKVSEGQKKVVKIPNNFKKSSVGVPTTKGYKEEIKSVHVPQNAPAKHSPQSDYDSLELIVETNQRITKPKSKTQERKKSSKRFPSPPSKGKPRSGTQTSINNPVTVEDNHTTQSKKRSKVTLYTAYGVWSILLVSFFVVLTIKIFHL